MEKDRFDYLMNTLPWDLSAEDLKESNEIKAKVMPIVMGEFLSKYKGMLDAYN